MLKNKPPKIIPEPTMLRRPWPPMYRGPVLPTTPQRTTSYAFRKSDPADWRDYPFSYTNGTNTNSSKKSVHSAYQPPKDKDYYFLAPYYRNVMPPPHVLNGNKTDRRDHLLMIDPSRKRTKHRDAAVRGNTPACSCIRSRSMDDVRTDIVEVCSEWERDENGNNVADDTKRKRTAAGDKVKGSLYGVRDPFGRRSVENLLIDTSYSPTLGSKQNNRSPDFTPVTRTDTENRENGNARPRFIAITTLEDVQAVRCAEFHPGGQLYAVGSNSKTLRICAYPKLADIRDDHQTYQPTVLFKRTKHHKGSIYCLAWSPMGDLLATGSNDKTVKLMRFNADTSNLEGQEIELSMHDGTIRDLCFIEDTSNKSSLLISGGAGDCKIYVTDCETGTPFQAMGGHSGHVLSLYNWGGAMFVSGSQDKTVRFWDLRTRGCVNIITPATVPGSRQQGSGVSALCVETSGRLLVSGHEDGSCALYDIRGNRPVQCFKPHASDIRSTRFSPSAYYLLTGGYDNKLVLTDLQGDLTMPLPSVVVAQHQDKVISGRWHPSEFSFISTSADKTATLWALPPI